MRNSTAKGPVEPTPFEQTTDESRGKRIAPTDAVEDFGVLLEHRM
jgi:hypothetical protein